MTSSSSSSTIAKLTASEVPVILAATHEKLAHIEALEGRLNDRAVRARRRTANLLEQAPTHRQSHLRCFVTHAFKEIPPTDESPLPASEWKLRLEGKLLIGHLDHASAAAVDAKTSYRPPTDDLDRSKGEKEEEEVLPIKFTHFFDRVEVQFQAIYSPKPNPMAAAMLAKKKIPGSASKKRRGANTAKAAAAAAAAEDEPDRSKWVPHPTPHELVWTKRLSEDAHAFDFYYPAPPPHESRYEIQSVVTKLQLFPAVNSKETVYTMTPALLQALFPHHVSSQAAKAAAAVQSKKRPLPVTAVDEGSGGGSTTPPPIATEPEIEIPETWTMADLSAAFFYYVQEHGLFDETLPTTVLCNPALQSLFKLERFAFAQLQSLLTLHNLIRTNPHGVAPIRITYICRVATATNAPPPSDYLMVDDDEPPPPPALLQLDMDVWVPSLFPFRCREILRRIKRRELEYTSSRTKARYILMARKAKDEEDVKNKIGQVVAREHLGRDLIPVQNALAKAALPRTEARIVHQTDARLSLLLAKLEEECASAQTQWKELQDLVGVLETASQVGVAAPTQDGGSSEEPEAMDLS
jgi:hypothetical protein